MSETKTRVHVTLEDFLRVTIADRETFDSIDSASAELGMTTASFKQRLITSRKRYPSLYEGTEPYTADARRVPTEAEAAELLASLLGDWDEGEDEDMGGDSE
jgi:hypothetical protein|tara:strand:- start:5305 stop:5610 length:306 start_codon:yes stop_codon:yes gene_type:complete